MDNRKIIHIDFDAFFASVEILDNPRLLGLPVAVGGLPSARGVISTCNYEARKYGIHSAMPSAFALKQCPELQLLPVRYDRYKEISAISKNIFYKYTKLVEPLSLDEAYLDVTNSSMCLGSATLIAQNIRKDIFDKLKLTVSAGVAPNMFLAKIASDWHKPNGMLVIKPNDVEQFVCNLPITKIHGVGSVTAKKMHLQNISTCQHLRELSITTMTQQFGKFGNKLWHLCRGIDNRQVIPNRRRKSISVEKTFSQDLQNTDDIIKKLVELYSRLKVRLNKLDDNYTPTKRFIKIKFSDYTISQAIEELNHLDDWQHFLKLLRSTLGDKFLPVRLLGIGIKIIDTSSNSYTQLQIDF